MSQQVHCDTHGSAGAAFVCRHTADAYAVRKPQPFFWTDANAPEPCGWCLDCQRRYEAAGNEWAGAAEEQLNAKLVCENCFRDIIKFNGYN